jgi:hypothetical protein
LAVQWFNPLGWCFCNRVGKQSRIPLQREAAIKTMSWKKSKFASSLMSLFQEAPADLRVESGIEDIREAMLECLRGVTPSDELAMAVGRLRCAPHVRALWYLRSDVMTLLADRDGEGLARRRIAQITAMFHGLLPPGHSSRPSPLNRH